MPTVGMNKVDSDALQVFLAQKLESQLLDFIRSARSDQGLDFVKSLCHSVSAKHSCGALRLLHMCKWPPQAAAEGSLPRPLRPVHGLGPHCDGDLPHLGPPLQISRNIS